MTISAQRTAAVAQVFYLPCLHPYTRAFIDSLRVKQIQLQHCIASFLHKQGQEKLLSEKLNMILIALFMHLKSKMSFLKNWLWKLVMLTVHCFLLIQNNFWY